MSPSFLGGRLNLDVFCFFVFLNLIWRFSRDFGGAVGLGVFFMSNEFGIMSKFGLGIDLWWSWGFEKKNCL